MKVLEEAIEPASGSSFKLLLTPGLYDTFLWHFHAEYEIVYVEGSSGIRHVGSHISRYEGSDLVFIGPNIPHLNFDYGVRTQCEQVIIQMKSDFLGQEFLLVPEMLAIKNLFDRASGGISFQGNIKEEIADILKQMVDLEPFDQLLLLLRILQKLSTTTNYELLGAEKVSSKSIAQKQNRMAIISRYVEEHFDNCCDVNEIATLVHLSTPAFCRFFKNNTQMTFTDFVNQYRVNQAKNELLQDKTVSEVCYAVGFESLSYFNKLFKRQVDLNPSAFKKGFLS